MDFEVPRPVLPSASGTLQQHGAEMLQIFAPILVLIGAGVRSHFDLKLLRPASRPSSACRRTGSSPRLR